MVRTKQRSEKSAFSLSAMVDVVFLLLLFFVATHVSERTEAFLTINQPSGPTQPGPPPFEAQVHTTGYYYMGRSVRLEKLEDHLQDVAVVDARTPIFIKVKPDATEGQLVALLDRCQKMSLSNLNIMTLK